MFPQKNYNVFEDKLSVNIVKMLQFRNWRIAFWTPLSFLQGKPRPKVTWSKDGEPLNPTFANVRNSDVDTILFIRKTDRKHSGKYDLHVQIENVEDTASITLQIVGKQD